MVGSRVERERKCDVAGETFGSPARAIVSPRRRTRVARLPKSDSKGQLFCIRPAEGALRQAPAVLPRGRPEGVAVAIRRCLLGGRRYAPDIIDSVSREQVVVAGAGAAGLAVAGML